MGLEDHAGDIIRKARGMSNVSASVAAKAAGLTEPELSALEDSGHTSKRLDCAALGRAVGVDGAKLERVIAGWVPSEKDLGGWRELRCITTSDGDMSVNCYLAWDEVSREAALFDTGWDAQPIIRMIADNQ